MRTFYTGKTGWIPPRPQDLTPEKMEQRMSFIKPGDTITFDSMKECHDITQLDRHSSTIKTSGTVVENCGCYLMVKLKRQILESVNYFGIYAVNGTRFHGYTGYGVKSLN